MFPTQKARSTCGVLLLAFLQKAANRSEMSRSKSTAMATARRKFLLSPPVAYNGQHQGHWCLLLLAVSAMARVFEEAAAEAAEPNLGPCGLEDALCAAPAAPDDLLVEVEAGLQHLRVDVQMAPEPTPGVRRPPSVLRSVALFLGVATSQRGWCLNCLR